MRADCAYDLEMRVAIVFVILGALGEHARAVPDDGIAQAIVDAVAKQDAKGFGELAPRLGVSSIWFDSVDCAADDRPAFVKCLVTLGLRVAADANPPRLTYEPGVQLDVDLERGLVTHLGSHGFAVGDPAAAPVMQSALAAPSTT